MTLDTGGLERLLVDFARLSDRDRFDLSFLVLEGLGHPAAELRREGFPVESLQMRQVGKWHALKRLRRIFRERRIDVLHTHNTYPQFYGALAAAWSGVPIVINTQHGRGCGTNWKSSVQFMVGNVFTDRVLGVSQDSARLCRRQDPFHAGKVECQWNAIDLEKFMFHGPANRPVAISVSRLSPEKDLGTLLRATAIVAREFPEFRLKIVGDGRERAALVDLTRELAIEPHVEFLGERSDVPHLLAKAGFFVSSSRTEGVSLTLLEAMAVGLPVVTTAVGGNPEVVLEGVTGRLVPPEQPEQLAQAMSATLSERGLWPAMAEAARGRVERHFDIRVSIRRYEALYRELLAGKRRH